MADLRVAPYRNGKVEIKKGFDVGAGPSRAVEDAIVGLENLVEDEELDEKAVQRVRWMQDWEDIILGEDRVKGWTRKSGADTVTAICAPKELERILVEMKNLRPHVRPDLAASWDELTKFLRACSKNGGTVCLWYDPMG